MPDSKAREPTDRITFARDLGVFDASMIGIGEMIGAGIFVLTGIATGEARPSAILAFALNCPRRERGPCGDGMEGPYHHARADIRRDPRPCGKVHADVGDAGETTRRARTSLVEADHELTGQEMKNEKSPMQKPKRGRPTCAEQR